MSRYAVRIGSAFALLLSLAAVSPAAAAPGHPAAYAFEGKRITFSRLLPQSGGRAVSIQDPGLQSLFAAIGATVTWQPGERYVLVTTAEPVVVSFALGDRRYDVGPVTQTASFAPFMLDGQAFVPFDELLRALDLAEKTDGSQNVLQPQLASIDVESSGAGARLIARGGMPLDAKIVSDGGGKIVLSFDGVGSMLKPTRAIAGGPIKRIDIRTEGTVASPRTLVTLYVAPGTTHGAAGTDDQRDFTIGFDGASGGQRIAAAVAPPSPAAQPQASPSLPEASPSAAGPVQVTGVQSQAQNGSFVVRVATNGAASFDWHRLRPPDNRWWIDVHGARLGIPPSDAPGNDLVSSVRVHQQSPDTVRIALSLGAFDAVSVTPDATGITITVSNQVANVDTEPRSGSGNTGANAAVAAVPQGSPAPDTGWKFGPHSSPSATPYVAPNPRLIVIDPGHGGSDPGSYRGDVYEKAITLDISLRLRDILRARGWQVMMTRDTDKDVYAPNDSAHDELQARDDVANNNGARLLVSIHVNAFMNAGPHGATVYYYKPSDLALAQALDRRIASELSIKDDGTVKDKLYVVHHAAMPASLVETAFISNPDDRALLSDPQWRQKMAQAIADGILDYAGAPPPATQAGGQ